MKFKLLLCEPKEMLSALDCPVTTKLCFEFEGTEKQISALLKFGRIIRSSNSKIISIPVDSFLKEDFDYIYTIIHNLEVKFLRKNSENKERMSGYAELMILFLTALTKVIKKNENSYLIRDYEFHFTEGFEHEIVCNLGSEPGKTFSIVANTGPQISALLKLYKVFKTAMDTSTPDVTVTEKEFSTEFDYISLIMNSIYEYARKISPEEKKKVIDIGCITGKTQASLIFEVLTRVKETVEKNKFELMDYDKYAGVLTPIFRFKELMDIRFHQMISPILEECIINFPKENIFTNKEGIGNICADLPDIKLDAHHLSGYWSTWKASYERDLGSSQVKIESVISCLVCKDEKTAKILQEAFDQCYVSDNDRACTSIQQYKNRFLFLSSLTYANLLLLKKEIKNNLKKHFVKNETLLDISSLKL